MKLKYLNMYLNIKNKMSLITITDSSKLNVNVSDHFKAKEFMCPCCKKVNINSVLIDKLEEFRNKLACSIYIDSAYRCINHNRSLKSGDKSEHVNGNAADLNLGHTKNAVEIFKQAAKIFNRVGIYQSDSNPKYSFIHVDVKPNEKTYWVCHKINGIQKYIYFESVDSLLVYLNTDTKIDWFHLVI